RLACGQATVAPRRKPAPGGVALEVRIEEGAPTRIAEVRFEGDLALDSDQLAAAFRLERGDVLNLGALDEAVRRVRQRYRLAGRRGAPVGGARAAGRGAVAGRG